MRDVARQVTQSQKGDASLDQANEESHQMAAVTLISSGVLARALSIAIEMALVGPLINCLLESKIAPTAVMTIAV